LISAELKPFTSSAGQIDTLSRAEVRRCFERCFTAERMALGGYFALYRFLAGGQSPADHTLPRTTI